MGFALDPYMPITAGVAVAVLTGHCALTKMMQTVMFRLKLTTTATPEAERNKVKESTFFKRVCSAQLNEAEYAPLFVAGLGYLALQKSPSPTVATLAVFGQISYYWARAFCGNSTEGGIDPPPYVPGALARYFALMLMAWEMYLVAV
ncbi:unnamed protein product [Amoebophrya sp. A120]|nr:unnamed protein product [Amoebophrya sp. A120]|eukprot:GSA120T00023490001.1